MAQQAKGDSLTSHQMAVFQEIKRVIEAGGRADAKTVAANLDRDQGGILQHFYAIESKGWISIIKSRIEGRRKNHAVLSIKSQSKSPEVYYVRAVNGFLPDAIRAVFRSIEPEQELTAQQVFESVRDRNLDKIVNRDSVRGVITRLVCEGELLKAGTLTFKAKPLPEHTPHINHFMNRRLSSVPLRRCYDALRA